MKYYHILTIFETKHIFYNIERLESVHTIRKIGAEIDAEKGIMEYNGKKIQARIL